VGAGLEHNFRGLGKLLASMLDLYQRPDGGLLLVEGPRSFFRHQPFHSPLRRLAGAVARPDDGTPRRGRMARVVFGPCHPNPGRPPARTGCRPHVTWIGWLNCEVLLDCWFVAVAVRY
jgi:hypothetical protein